jgi:hypothetical protein
MAATIESILGKITYNKSELQQHRIFYRRMEKRKTQALINKQTFAKGQREGRLLLMKDMEDLPSFQKQLKKMKSMLL